MGAVVSLSALESTLLRRVLDHRVVPRLPGALVLEFRPPYGRHGASETGSPAAAQGAEAHEHGSGGKVALAQMRALACERARTEARMVQVAKDVVAATGAALLADKGFTSVSELSATATKKWRAEAKATAVAEVQVLLGMGITDARRLVGLATAPDRTQRTVVNAMYRGDASLDMALRFWERCGRLQDDDGADVADAMFGTDPDTAAEERLDAQGNLKDRPWPAGEYDAALEREALRREGRDAEAKREQRRRAREERDASLRVGDNGTATLSIRCPLTTGAAIYQRIDRCSRGLRAAGDPRTLRQLRADVSAALLLYGVLPLPEDGESDGPDDGHLADPGFEDLVSPADLEAISRIVTATPPVQLQVVIPWDVLYGRPAGAAFCPAPCCRAASGRASGPDDPVTAGAGHDAGHDPDPPDPPAPPDHDPDPPDPPAPPDHDPDPPDPSAPPNPSDPPNTPEPPSGPARSRRRGQVGEIVGMHQAFITPEHARALALQPGSTLARLLVDPADGRLVERTVKTYRPDADMRRQVRAADVMSRAPGSRHPAKWCDIDHEQPWAEGGATSETNLNLKDRTAHKFKTLGWWTTSMAPNRDVTWVTLLGQEETTRCHDYRQYLDERVPLDPEQAEVHPSQRRDLDDRLDVACQALYAALVHRDPHAHLADRDDHHGATEHDPSLGGWVWVSHTNPDGIRRYGPPADPPTVEEVLGMAPEEGPDTPWGRRTDDDAVPPF